MLYIDTHDKLIKCLGTIRIHFCFNTSNALLTLPNVSLSPILWIDTSWRQLRSYPVKSCHCEKKATPLHSQFLSIFTCYFITLANFYYRLAALFVLLSTSGGILAVGFPVPSTITTPVTHQLINRPRLTWNQCCLLLAVPHRFVDFREGFCEAGELTRTFLRQGLLPGGVSRNLFDGLVVCSWVLHSAPI